jgi:hypothetical protein
LYQRIQHRRGEGEANIVPARKILGVSYHALWNIRVFADFSKFVLASYSISPSDVS